GCRASAFPRFGDDHRHAMAHVAPRQGEEFHGVVEHPRVAVSLLEDWAKIKFPEGLAPQRGLPRGHPIGVSPYRVDLAVVREEAERLHAPPRGGRVGAVTLVKNRESRLEFGIG